MILPWSQSLEQQWDAYCDSHPLAWFWHRSGWMSYCAARPDVLNLSFAVIEEGKIIAVCPIMREGTALLYDGAPCPEPLYDNDTAKREMFLHLRALIDSYQIDTYDFRGDIIGMRTADLSWKTRIIDLRANSYTVSQERWLHVRKSYKSIIHQASKTHCIVKSNDPNDVAVLHFLHTEQAGRETRSQRTWDLMAEWVRAGHAYLCTATNSYGVCDGAIYVYAYKGHDYYGHAATRVKDINHALLWKAISTSDAETFGVGWQGHAENDKEQRIEFFKRGFGGADVPFVVSRLFA